MSITFGSISDEFEPMSITFGKRIHSELSTNLYEFAITVSNQLFVTVKLIIHHEHANILQCCHISIFNAKFRII